MPHKQNWGWTSYFLPLYVLFNAVKDVHSHPERCFLLLDFMGKCKNKKRFPVKVPATDKVPPWAPALFLIWEVGSEQVTWAFRVSFLYSQEKRLLKSHDCVLLYKSETGGDESPAPDRSLLRLTTSMLKVKKLEEISSCHSSNPLEKVAFFQCMEEVEKVKCFLEENSSELALQAGDHEVTMFSLNSWGVLFMWPPSSSLLAFLCRTKKAWEKINLHPTSPRIVCKLCSWVGLIVQKPLSVHFTRSGWRISKWVSGNWDYSWVVEGGHSIPKTLGLVSLPLSIKYTWTHACIFMNMWWKHTLQKDHLKYVFGLKTQASTMGDNCAALNFPKMQ